jgi:radical SAM superfamily enzyme YgiQ (UPF0313 family)
MRSAGSIVKEMENFYSTYGVNRFNFVDDNFLNNDGHVSNFCRALKESNIKFRWRFQGRADRFSRRLAEEMLEVGLYDVSFGIESGSQNILNEMHKKLDISKAIMNLKDIPSELDTHASFIVGMPSESHQTITETIEFIHNAGIKNVNCGILTLFPGTSIYEYAKFNGFITDDEAYCDDLGPVYSYPYVNLTSYPDEQLLGWSKLINEQAVSHTN